MDVHDSAMLHWNAVWMFDVQQCTNTIAQFPVQGNIKCFTDSGIQPLHIRVCSGETLDLLGDKSRHHVQAVAVWMQDVDLTECVNCLKESIFRQPLHPHGNLQSFDMNCMKDVGLCKAIRLEYTFSLPMYSCCCSCNQYRLYVSCKELKPSSRRT